MTIHFALSGINPIHLPGDNSPLFIIAWEIPHNGGIPVSAWQRLVIAGEFNCRHTILFNCLVKDATLKKIGKRTIEVVCVY
jgi:hypothetical protein